MRTFASKNLSKEKRWLTHPPTHINKVLLPLHHAAVNETLVLLCAAYTLEDSPDEERLSEISEAMAEEMLKV